VYKQAIETEAREDGWNAGMEAGRKEVLLTLVRKKLAKGKTPEVIAEEMEENIETVMNLIREVDVIKHV